MHTLNKFSAYLTFRKFNFSGITEYDLDTDISEDAVRRRLVFRWFVNFVKYINIFDPKNQSFWQILTYIAKVVD